MHCSVVKLFRIAQDSSVADDTVIDSSVLVIDSSLLVCWIIGLKTEHAQKCLDICYSRVCLLESFFISAADSNSLYSILFTYHLGILG